MNPVRRESTGRVLVVGTAPPTRCGLATYTYNLSSAIATQHLDVDILRILDEGESNTGEPVDVRAHWHRQSPTNLDMAADLSNDYDAVLLQHEFGIYPGNDGIDVLRFLENLEVPVVSVMHTMLAEPSEPRRRIVSEIADRSSALIVHTSTARDRLIDSHDVDHEKVRIIPHGASSRIGLSQPLDRTVPSMLTWGLIGPGKGIEHGIEAVARLRSGGMDVEYVVSGATHPNVLRDSGDGYRHGLMALARRCGVDDLVRFDAHYRSREEQDQLLRNAAMILLPYDSRDQVTSGVLVEALAAGKPIISTRFPHATELSDCGGIALVDHEHPDQIARRASEILGDSQIHDRMRSAAWLEGLRHDWDLVGSRFNEVLRAVTSTSPIADVIALRPSHIEEAVVV